MSKGSGSRATIGGAATGAADLTGPGLAEAAGRVPDAVAAGLCGAAGSGGGFAGAGGVSGWVAGWVAAGGAASGVEDADLPQLQKAATTATVRMDVTAMAAMPGPVAIHGWGGLRDLRAGAGALSI